MSGLVIHIGFPKTGTTTLQRHLFARHPEITYLGKQIPGYGFFDERLGPALEYLARAPTAMWRGDTLRDLTGPYARSARGQTVLLSSESLLHVTANDPAIVARRLRDAFGPCRIVVTIREQLAAIESFFGMHGRFGQYLMLELEEGETARFPLSMNRWLDLSLRSLDRSYLGLVRYHETLMPFWDTFGPDGMLVLPFEDLVGDRTNYSRRLCNFLEVDGRVGDAILAGAHETANLTSRELAVLQLLGLRGGAHPRVLEWRERSGWLYHWLRGGPQADRRIPAVRRSHLEDLYRAGNARLQERIGLDLAGKGYAI